MAKEHLIIFDTTMRDGEQSPGASMTKEEKIQIAIALERMRVDIIEAGFPAASPGDFAAVKAVAGAVSDCTVCGLARALDKDIRAAAEALQDAKSKRIHTFIATSPIHMKMKLKMEPKQVLEQIGHAVRLARQFSDDIEFSPEDAGRSDFDFLCRAVETAIAAGATTINIPDTVGYNIPHQFGDTVRRLREAVPSSDKAVFSVHCHNDLGLATANSLAAVLHGGARQVECTVNALGERAGNASLEEVVMAVRTRQDVYPCDTSLDTTQIMSVSRLVSNITGFPVQPNKAIVGANAFAHEAGIHQDGMLKHRETYEIMKPEDVGLGQSLLVLGKHSGRRALRARLDELGLTTQSEEEMNRVFARFKELADVKHEIYDDDLRAMVSDVLIGDRDDYIKFVSMQVRSETGEPAVAVVTLKVHGEEVSASMRGSGPVDAAYKAVESLVHSECKLQLYAVNNITGGTDAQGEVSVRIVGMNGRVVNGHGADTDIIIASVKAYVGALNKIQLSNNRVHPQAAAV
ncbi:MAG: 2-isopropylmalate synthase [Candidatus Porifericomitaceae bacterium WSBS_2022_MAG_OTU9]